MKVSLMLFILSISLLLNACGNANQINGTSLKTALKSVAFIKERLPLNQRVEFEVAYWSLRNQYKDDAEFLKTIDQKSATDIVALGKAEFAKNQAAGNAEVAQFANWEQMIAQQIEQRGQQDRTAIDPKDKKDYPRVDYKMHAM